MAKNARYNLPYRRRREGKTDYKSRIALIRSGSPRFVVRPSNEHIIVQIPRIIPEEKEHAILKRINSFIKNHIKDINT